MLDIVGSLDAEISVTELRREELVTERLERHHAVRVRRRGEVIGVLLDANLWSQLEARFERLEAELEAYEDQAVLALIASRADAEYVVASDDVVADVFEQYQSLVEDHDGAERGN